MSEGWETEVKMPRRFWGKLGCWENYPFGSMTLSSKQKQRGPSLGRVVQDINLPQSHRAAASASIPPSIRAGNGSNYQPAPLFLSPIIARTCSRRSLTPSGSSSSPTPSPSSLMIPPPPPPLLAVARGHVDPAAMIPVSSRPGEQGNKMTLANL